MNATGHMLVNRIAWDHLTPKAQKMVEDLTHNPNNPVTGKPTTAQDNDVFTAATWMDDIKPTNREMHFTDLPLDGDGKIPQGPNSYSFISAQIAILKDAKAATDHKAEALRNTMHLMGDTHQPLHNCTHDDHGGNGFPLDGKKNLHSFWDSGANQWNSIKRPLDAAGQAQLDKLAASIEKQYPMEKYTVQAQDLDPAHWIQEGWTMAKNDVYTDITPGQAPSPQYTERAQKDMNLEAALAGYRMANLLNGIFN